jgi:hypothetical protein
MAERSTTIYLVKTGTLAQLVEAKTKSQALAFIAKNTHAVSIPTQSELITLAKAGVEVQQAD